MASDSPPTGTEPGGEPAISAADLALTDTQRQILLALCRPCIGENRYATPATNHDIAAEVFLSVDAVKAHLRTLYRKFGVEPLPHNQKRIRLVELVLENQILEGGELQAPAAAERPATTQRTGGGPPRRRRWVLGVAALAGVAAIAGVLALAGVFSSESGGDEETLQPLPKAQYVEAAADACRLSPFRRGLIETENLRGATTAERAEAYGLVIGDLRSRVEALPPPLETSPALDRFQAGLARAADLTGATGAQPPQSAGDRSKLVAELTIAAGQVQAGAVGYGLGPECAGVADLIARSARNAALVP